MSTDESIPAAPAPVDRTDRITEADLARWSMLCCTSPRVIRENVLPSHGRDAYRKSTKSTTTNEGVGK